MQQHTVHRSPCSAPSGIVVLCECVGPDPWWRSTHTHTAKMRQYSVKCSFKLIPLALTSGSPACFSFFFWAKSWNFSDTALEVWKRQGPSYGALATHTRPLNEPWHIGDVLVTKIYPEVVILWVKMIAQSSDTYTHTHTSCGSGGLQVCLSCWHFGLEKMANILKHMNVCAEWCCQRNSWVKTQSRSKQILFYLYDY